MVQLCLFGVPGVLSCAPGSGGCSASPVVADLPTAPQSLSQQARVQAADPPLGSYSDELIDTVLEGTGVSAGAATEGETSPLAGTFNTTTKEPATAAAQQTELHFDSTGAATELRLFSEELAEQAILAFPAQTSTAKAAVQGTLLGTGVSATAAGGIGSRRAEGILLGTRVSTTDGRRFDVTVVAVLDTQENGLTVRTREIFQFVLAFGPDRDTLVGAGRRTSEVIDSTDPARPAGAVSESVAVTELGRNRPPVADAGPDQTVAEQAAETGFPRLSVVLDGSASSDPEGAPLAFTWTQTGGPDAPLFDADGPQPGFFFREVLDADVTFTFQLTVTDSAGQTDTDEVVITAQALAGR